MRRASALAEFVLFLPFLFFIIAMIFHFGVSTLRKQRTLVAARFAADAAVRGIADGDPHDYWENPVSHNQYARGQAYPDPQDHFLGLFEPKQIQPRFLPRVAVESVQLTATWPQDGLDRLKREVDARDHGQPRATEVTRMFWEQLAATNQTINGDVEFRWHQYALGARVAAAYRPNGPYYERLQGPITTHYYRESGSFALPHPEMWWEVTHSPPVAELQQFFYDLSQDAVMGRTGDAMFRWFRH